VDPTLLDADPAVRKSALYALGPDDVKQNLAVLIAMAMSDPEPAVRYVAMGLLGTSRDPRVLPVLKAALQDWEDTSAQLTAATALGNVRHPQACVVLVDALVVWPSEKDPVLEAIVSALLLSDPVCNEKLRERKPERPNRIGEVLLAISRRR
jgi:HEAT repeat protein